MLVTKLIAGHWRRYRGKDLLDRVVRAKAGGGWISRIAISLLNLSLWIRHQVHVHLELPVRSRLSRSRYLRQERDATGKRRIISLLCPSRERVHNVDTFITSVCRSAAHADRVEILFYVDDDDPRRDQYRSYFQEASFESSPLLRCELKIGPPIGISKAWTVLAAQSAGDLLCMANDDQYYVDYAWDVTIDRICDDYPDDIVCLYFEDESHESVPADGVPRGNFPIVTRKWFDIVGHFTPGIFKFWCNEIWILDIAQRIGRLRSIPDVLVDHLHYDAYKAPFDETYYRPQASGQVASDDRQLFAATAIERLKAAAKLNRAIRAASDTAAHTC
jgi:hypothetical protein